MTQTVDQIAARLQRAFAERDLSTFGTLLAEDARWGDDDAINKCRSRADVVNTFVRVLDEGVEGAVVDVMVTPAGILCELEVAWPQPDPDARAERFFHVYLVRDSAIAEIRRFDDRNSAVEALLTAPLGEVSAADQLVAAIHLGDVGGVEQLLATDPGLATSSLGGRYGTRTALHAVTDWPGYFPNGPQIAKLLLAAGADPNARDTEPRSESPLHWAASSDDADVARVLIDGGADVNLPDGSIGTPLENAVGYGCWNVARLLVERGAIVESLWVAGALGMVERLQELLAAQPHLDVELVSQGFWHACGAGQRRAAEFLLAAGADLKWSPDYADGTALDAARGLGTQQENVITWLQERGCRSQDKTE